MSSSIENLQLVTPPEFCVQVKTKSRSVIYSFLGSVLIACLSLCCVDQVKAFNTSWVTEDDSSLDLLVQAIKSTDNTAVKVAMLRGMLSGLEGRRNVAAPKGWPDVSDELRKNSDGDIRELVEQLAQIFGDELATERALATLMNAEQDLQDRKIALKALLSQQNKAVVDKLPQLLIDNELRLDAIRAFAVMEHPRASAILLEYYPSWDAEFQRAVIETLATRKVYARALLNAIIDKSISKEDIPSYVARSMDSILGEAFTEVFGDVQELNHDKAELIAKYKALAGTEAMTRSNGSNGRAVFKKTCGTCHLMYGEGGKIGPDLTGSNRANLDYILLNMVDPSFDVPEGYRMVNIETINGRLLSGIIAEEDNQRIILKTAEDPAVVVPIDDIEQRAVSKLSLMPDGQLPPMKDQEVLDLIKYLQTVEQVGLPE